MMTVCRGGEIRARAADDPEQRRGSPHATDPSRSGLERFRVSTECSLYLTRISYRDQRSVSGDILRDGANDQHSDR